MSMVVGTVCDSCGASDIDRFETGREVDHFPRNGWLSITIWEGEPEGRPESDFHVCSVKCMGDFANRLLKEEHDYGHEHEHAH